MSSNKQTVKAETLNEKRYAETFAAFLACTSEDAAMMTRLQEAVSQKLPKEFSCLDIGAGTGSVIQGWVQSKQPIPSRYVAVEPNPVHAEQLRKTLPQLPIANAEVLQREFHKEFSLPEEQNETFDMFLFSHSLYWIPNPVDCIDYALTNLVKPNGIAIVFLQGPFAFWSFCRLFEPLLLRNRAPGPRHDLSSFDLLTGLRNLGYAEHKLQYVVDPAALHLTKDMPEEHMEEILSFILQAEVSQIEQQLRNDIRQHFRAACVTTDKDSGDLLFHHPNVTIVVSKKEE